MTKSVKNERNKEDAEEVKLEHEVLGGCLSEGITLPWQHAAPLHTTPVSVLCLGNKALPRSASAPLGTHRVTYNTRNQLHNKLVVCQWQLDVIKQSELLVLWMQILHFRLEVFILLRNEVALGEVTGESRRTVIPHLRCE